MDAVIITFDLVDMTHERYGEVCAELAPAFAALPGLLTKIWITDPERACYGGVYLFKDADSASGFLGSALARSVASNPHFGGLDVRRFAVDETTTALTQAGIEVVPGRSRYRAEPLVPAGFSRSGTSGRGFSGHPWRAGAPRPAPPA
jgi:hypothetical protein